MRHLSAVVVPFASLLAISANAQQPDPTLVKGFKRLSAAGSRGWVAPDSGWSAGALVKDEAIVVVVSGGKATEIPAVALPQEVIKRRKKLGERRAREFMWARSPSCKCAP